MNRRLTQEAIADIITDYKAGMPTLEIASKYGVSDRTIIRHARAAGLRRSKPAQPRPVLPCEDCGEPTTYLVCRGCRGDGIALTEGYWAPAGGIVRWVSLEAAS